MPAMESWRNINAINDLVHEILTTSSHLVVAGLRGNAGAGGAMLALAADYVFARDGVVLNPHYKGMGGLYGSEYWTYTLPRRVGEAKAIELTEECRAIGTKRGQSNRVYRRLLWQHRRRIRELPQAKGRGTLCSVKTSGGFFARNTADVWRTSAQSRLPPIAHRNWNRCTPISMDPIRRIMWPASTVRIQAAADTNAHHPRRPAKNWAMD